MGSSAGSILGVVALGAAAYFTGGAALGAMGAGEGAGAAVDAGAVFGGGADAAAVGSGLVTSGGAAAGAAADVSGMSAGLVTEGGTGVAASGGGLFGTGVSGGQAFMGLEAGSQLMGGVAAKEAGTENAAIANYNAQIAGQNAKFASEAGEQAAGNESLTTRAEAGGALAQEGASGVLVGSGSFQDTQKSIRQIGELNALTIRSNAARQAYGFQSQKVGDTTQAAIDTSQGNWGLASGAVGAGGTTLLNATGGNPWGAYAQGQGF